MAPRYWLIIEEKSSKDMLGLVWLVGVGGSG